MLVLPAQLPQQTAEETVSEQSLNYAVDLPPQSNLRRLPGEDLCVPLGCQERPVPQGEVAPGQAAQAGGGEVSTLQLYLLTLA